MKSIICALTIILGISLFSPTPIQSQTEKTLIVLSSLVGPEITYTELKRLRIIKYFNVNDFDHLKIYLHENRYLVDVHFNNKEVKTYSYPEEKAAILKPHIKINNYLNNILNRILPEDKMRYQKTIGP